MNQVMDFWNNSSTMVKVMIGVLVVAVLFYVYQRYQLSQQEEHQMMMIPPENFGMGSVGQTTGNARGAGGEIVCTMYYVDWCPHCKTAKPEWEKFMQMFNGKEVNGKKVLVVKINCEENPDAAKEAGVEGYPSFKFNLNGKDFDYDDERVADRFEAFLHYLAQM
jgi:thiol-disulfide isomerase/thioredoxin